MTLASYACARTATHSPAGNAAGASARSLPAAADEGPALAYPDTAARAAPAARGRSAAERHAVRSLRRSEAIAFFQKSTFQNTRLSSPLSTETR
jgi:hypothetical protein